MRKCRMLSWKLSRRGILKSRGSVCLFLSLNALYFVWHIEQNYSSIVRADMWKTFGFSGSTCIPWHHTKNQRRFFLPCHFWQSHKLCTAHTHTYEILNRNTVWHLIVDISFSMFFSYFMSKVVFVLHTIDELFMVKCICCQIISQMAKWWHCHARLFIHMVVSVLERAHWNSSTEYRERERERHKKKDWFHSDCSCINVFWNVWNA